MAWHPLGWDPVAFSEIEAFPSAVLAHHYPSVPNWGDMTKFKEWPDADVDLLVGGTPCQSFSVAGLRKGLADPRGNLMLTYLAIADKYRPEWLVWENVPGVLSSGNGRDFGALLGGLAELGYGFAYRVLDAQYFGVAQRRRRVFVVGSARGWQRAAAVLFERASLSGHPAPRRESGEDTSGSTGDGVARCVTTGEAKRQDWETCNIVSHSLSASGFDASEDGTGRGTPLVPVAFNWQATGKQTTLGANTLGANTVQAVAFQLNGDRDDAGVSVSEDAAFCLPANPMSDRGQAVAFAQNQRDEVRTMSVAGALASEPGMKQQKYVAQHAMQVRRLTPRECERLQGFPDDYTLIPYRKKPAADGPRYKALGNSMAVPCMAWIGKRIAQVAAIPRSQEVAA